MTIPASPSEVSYAGDGVSYGFPIPFVFDTSADIKVVFTTAGVPTEQINGFSISGGGGLPGICTFIVIPPVGTTVTLIDDPDITQTADYVSNDPFPAESHERALDRTVRQVKRINGRVDRSMRVADGDLQSGDNLLLPISSVRANKFASYDSVGRPTVSSGTGNDSALRTDLATATIGAEGDKLVAHRHPGTGSVATTIYAILRGMTFVSMFGAVGDGVTDDRAAVQAAIDWVSLQGGGAVAFEYGKNYRLVCGGTATLTCQASALVKSGVALEGNGATLTCEVGNGNQCAVWLFGDKTSIRNATVNAVSSGAPGSQFFFHSAIAIGVPNNAGDTAASPSVGQFMSGWTIENVQLSTTRQYCPVIQGIGGIHNGVIRNILVPSSALHSGIYLDWGNVGSVSSSAIATTRTNFNGGTAYTTHPHNIDITGVNVGTLSAAVSGDNGGIIVRESGCYGVRVNGAEAESVTLAGWVHTGGDMGFEFARPEDKRHAYRGNLLKRMTIRNPVSTAYGALVDTLGDNIYREQFVATPYAPLANPLWHGDVVIEDCDFAGSNTDNTYGIRIIQARGVRVRRNSLQRWKYGVYVDEFTQDVDVDDNDIFGNRDNGIQVGTQQLRENTERVWVRRNRVYGNGTATTAVGVRISRGTSIRVVDNDFGVPGEAVQARGLLLDDIAGACRDIRITDNRCHGATTAAYTLQSGTPADALMYRVITEYRNNSSLGVTSISGGQVHIPVSFEGIGNYQACRWQNPNGGAPSDGVWYRGDWSNQATPTAATKSGDRCVTAGQFGTLAAITNGATNGTAVITCSLTGITVTTVLSTYSVVVSSATGIRAGMKCSIAAAGITNAMILSVSGTTLQLDTQANASQAGGAFTTSGLIEGEVISLNTTPARSSCVVLKVNGTSVSLDTSMGSTESGRTITYTTPVFKAEGALAA